MRYLIILLILTSCATTKNKRSTDTNIKEKEQGTIISKRKADTLNYTILKPIYKDTTIVVENKDNRSTLYVKYNDKGEQDISYICDELEEVKTYIREIEENKTEKLKDKDSVFKPIFILYGFIGFAFLMLLSRVLKRFGI